MWHFAIVLLLALGSVLSTTNAARILAIFPVAGKSHFSCNEAMMKSLHAAGHHITLISPFPPEKKIENFTTIDSRFDNFIYVGQSSFSHVIGMSIHRMIERINQIDIQYCYDVMKLKEVQEMLNSKVKLYDVMFTELFMTAECYLPIAEKLGIPVIGTVTLHSWKSADKIIGIWNNPAIISLETSSSRPGMDFIERIINTWNDLFIEYLHYTLTRTNVDKFYREKFSEDLVYKKKFSLIFYNNHPTLLPRPSIPNVIEIGGIHLKPANPLPEDFQKFIDGAKHGVILFTFGSVVKTSTLEAEKRKAFIDAFSSVPQRVIWKFEEPIENLPENIMISSWLPQRDILEHKNVIAFMTHCGQSGTYEAIHTGTPVVAIPLYGDQPSNAALLHHRGVAVPLDYGTLTKETILIALNTIVNDTRYYERMQELSRSFKDRPLTPQESIVYWTEYVIRHNGASYLEPLGIDAPMYQYLMLDIIGFFLVIIIVVIYIVYRMMKKCYSLVISPQKSNYEISVKKKN